MQTPDRGEEGSYIGYYALPVVEEGAQLSEIHIFPIMFPDVSARFGKLRSY